MLSISVYDRFSQEFRVFEQDAVLGVDLNFPAEKPNTA